MAKKKSVPKRKANIPAFIKQKKISAQSVAYIAGYKLQPIQHKKIFDKVGIRKEGSRYINMQTGRPFKNKAKALDYAAKQSGISSWDKYLKMRKLRVYKQFEKRAREKGVDVILGGTFVELFRDWQKIKYQKKSQQLRTLLKQLEWIDAQNYARYV